MRGIRSGGFSNLRITELGRGELGGGGRRGRGGGQMEGRRVGEGEG